MQHAPRPSLEPGRPAHSLPAMWLPPDRQHVGQRLERLEEEQVGHPQQHWRHWLAVPQRVEGREVGVVDGEVGAEVEGEGEGGDQGHERGNSLGALRGGGGEDQQGVAHQQELPEVPQLQEDAVEGGEEVNFVEDALGRGTGRRRRSGWRGTG